MSDLECSPQLARMLANRRTLAEVEAQRRGRLLAEADDLERAIQVAYQRGALEPEVWPLKQQMWRLRDEARQP